MSNQPPIPRAAVELVPVVRAFDFGERRLNIRRRLHQLVRRARDEVDHLTEKDDNGKVVQEFDHRESFKPKAFEFLALRGRGIPALDSPLAPDTPLQQLARKDPATARDIGPASERIKAYELSKAHDARTTETDVDIFRKVKDDRRIWEEELSRKRKVREKDEYASRDKLR